MARKKLFEFLRDLTKIIFVFLSSLAIALTGCETETKETGMPALFDTKAEAENAAKNFGCTGAHQMGEKWMPCNSHKTHEGHHNH